MPRALAMRSIRFFKEGSQGAVCRRVGDDAFPYLEGGLGVARLQPEQPRIITHRRMLRRQRPGTVQGGLGAGHQLAVVHCHEGLAEIDGDARGPGPVSGGKGQGAVQRLVGVRIAAETQIGGRKDDPALDFPRGWL